MIDKEERRRALDLIESFEDVVNKARRALNMCQHEYLKSLGFTFESESEGFLFVEYYYYKDEMFVDIDHALEYADEHI